MKLLLVSDLHYTLQQLDWVSGAADDFDVVVLAGDHLDISAVLGVDAQIIVLLKYLRRLKEHTRVVVCSGNHDLNGRNDAGERTARWMAKVRELGVSTDGDFLELGGLSITVCPWWDGPAARAQVAAQLARDAARRAERWLWVYHAPPDESPVSWGGQRYFGDAELLKWIHQYQPSLVLSGHVHQSPFRAPGSWVDRIGGTWVFNSGRHGGPCPPHVVFDLDAETATWSSLAGVEMVHLDAALSRPIAEVSPP